MNEDNNEMTGELDITNLDKAINDAKERKGSRGEPQDAPQGGDEQKAKRPRLSPEDRAERDRIKAEELAARKAERARLKALKAEQKTARPAHIHKVLKAAETLPALPEDIKGVFADLTNGDFNLESIEPLVSHLGHFVRAERTRLALETTIEVGQLVRIRGGEPRFIGQVGRVERCQRIRCYVALDGIDKPVYLYTSDVEVVSDVSDVGVPEEEQTGS